MDQRAQRVEDAGKAHIPSTPPMSLSPGSIAGSAIEVDSYSTAEDDDWDEDSASIISSIRDYEFENGRRYHAYKAGHYPLPNDESELERLDIEHHVVTLLLGGELFLAPLTQPMRVLDIGTGTGIWAIEMADRFPKALVVGTDLSPIQPTWVPPNVRFEIDDVESEWTYKPASFDFIHSRLMIGAISDWKSLIRKAYRYCNDGGYFEIQELDPQVHSDDGTHMKGSTTIQWTNMMCQASAEYGKPVPRHYEYKLWLKEEGFINIQQHIFKIPLNTWPKTKILKEVGRYQNLNYTEGCEGMCIGLFTRVLQWQPVEVQVLCAKFRSELKDRSIHSYQYFTVVVGQKPKAQFKATTMTVDLVEPDSHS